MRRISLSKRRQSANTSSSGRTPYPVRPDPLEFAMMSPSAVVNSTHYLTNDEAAAFLKLSPRTLEKQRVKGTGPRFRKFGRRVVYSLQDLESWSNERVFDSTAAANPDNYR
jgi:hypothetical protein